MALSARRRGAVAGATNGPHGSRVLAHYQTYILTPDVLLRDQAAPMFSL